MRRIKKNTFIKFLPFTLVITGIICIGIYFILLNPVNINCGILIDKKPSSNFIRLKLGYKDKTKWIMIRKKTPLVEAIAYNVKLKGFIVQSISPCNVVSGKVLKRNPNSINIDDKDYKISKNIYYSKMFNGKLKSVSPNNVIIGYSTYKFLLNNKNEIEGVLVDKPEIDTIRVGISDSNFTTLNHSSVLFYSKRKMNLNIDNKELEIPRGSCLRADYKNKSIILSLYSKDKENLVFTSNIGMTKNRIYLSSPSMTNISLLNIKRITGYTPSYPGSFEISIDDNSLHIINEVNIEDYLKYVVPSEMLPSGGIEAYKVQAVAARTYVLSDMLSGRFSKNGFHVDDSTLSQVYNSVPTNPLCEQAVNDTIKQVITYDNKIIDAKYYSTSCGFGAPFNEVWYSSEKLLNQNPEPYISFKNYSGNKLKDLSNEDDASNFLKDWTIKAYDSNSPYFRWKYTMDKKLMNTVINSNIYERYLKKPNDFKQKWIAGIYKKASIPANGIGKIKDIYINKRGKAGNVMSMTLVSETGTYKIDRDSNIKYILTPKKVDFEITLIYGSPLKNTKTLPSSFFVIDKQLQGDRIQSITIYGGGFGHGAGLSQYGVIGLVRQDKTYKDIINTFYNNVSLQSYPNVVKNSFK